MSDYLPEEVVTDILSRLPVKSLIKFRCVCKSWCSQIQSPNFIKMHLNHAKTNGKKLLLTRYMSSSSPIEQYSLRFDDGGFDEYDAFECPFKTKFHFRVVGVCNGLVCLSDDLFGYTYTHIIWNPAIRRFLELPKPSLNYTSHGPFMAVLGFGFDAQKDDFKLVRLFYPQSEDADTMFNDTPMVEVYSVRTGSWRRIKLGILSFNIAEYIWSQAFVNGSVHWAAYKRKNKGFLNVVSSFNMTHEKFGILEFPESLANLNPWHFSVGVHESSLALFACDRPNDDIHFEVFVMKEYGVGGSWSKIIRVEIKDVIRTILGFREEREMLIVTQENEIAAFEPGSKRTKIIGTRGYVGSLYAAGYEESLALLNGDFASLLKGYESLFTSKDSSDEENVMDQDGIEKLVFRGHEIEKLVLRGYFMASASIR